MYPESGYKTISVLQFINGLALLEAKRIKFRCFRVYMAAFTLVAIREAAARARRKVLRRRGETLPHYRIGEIAALCAISEAAVRHDLKVLLREQLVSFAAGDIRIRRSALEGLDDLISLTRSPSRPIPVPRAVLRFLAKERRNSVSKVMVAYMIRGLTIDRTGGVVRSRGSAKVSWVSALTGLSERSTRYARAELIKNGWLAADTGSTQWKLNRHGAYFEIILTWRPSSFAPRPPENAAAFAPPIENKKTLIRIKNQKTTSGVLKEEREGNLPPPTMHDVRAEDLRSLGRMEVLYSQAVAANFVRESEASVLNFIAAAVRAREAQGEPARIFSGIVRQGLWHHITCAQEEIARRALNRIREDDPDRFRKRYAVERSFSGDAERNDRTGRSICFVNLAIASLMLLRSASWGTARSRKGLW